MTRVVAISERAKPESENRRVRLADTAGYRGCRLVRVYGLEDGGFRSELARHEHPQAECGWPDNTAKLRMNL